MALFEEDVRSVLQSGQLEKLVGEFESDFLECKRRPYPLDSDQGKLELAKDVAAFANAQGGLILIGFATERDEAHSEDRVTRVRAFEADLVDQSRMEDVLNDWIYPPIRGLEIEWFALAENRERGVIGIDIPQVEGGEQPVLLRRVILDDRKRSEILAGYCERKQARVVHWGVERLHGLIRDGLRFDEEMGQGLQSALEMLEDLRRKDLRESRAGLPEDLEERLDRAVKAVEMEELPRFCLTAAPFDRVDFKDLFAARTAELVELLENPPVLRNGGFHLVSGSNSRIINGRLRRVATDYRRLLEFHRDGVIIFVTRGDEDGLCWGSDKMDRRLINQIVLAEQTYLFCLLVVQAYQVQGQTGRLQVQIRISGLQAGGQVARLERGPLGDFREPRAREAHADTVIGTSELVLSEFASDEAVERIVGRTAYEIVSEVYHWFGLDDSAIPYVSKSDDGAGIDREQLASIG